MSTEMSGRVGSVSDRIRNLLASRIRIRNSGVQIRGYRRNIYDHTTAEANRWHGTTFEVFLKNDVPEGGAEEPEVLGLVPHPLPAQAEAGHHQHLQVHAHLHHINS